MKVAFFCCFRQGVAGMSRDLGRNVPDLEKPYARKLWADFSYPTSGNVSSPGLHSFAPALSNTISKLFVSQRESGGMATLTWYLDYDVGVLRTSQKHRKNQSDPKVTQKWLPGSHPRVTPSDSKMTQTWRTLTQRSEHPCFKDPILHYKIGS